jgi:DNA-binding NarL/FixJ family response regulator
MQRSSVFIAQADARLGSEFAARLQVHFRDIHVLKALPELRGALAQQKPYALIVALELIGIEELREICRSCPETVVVSTHRVADEEMWLASLAAGAADCCAATDFAGMLRAIARRLPLARAAVA